MKLSLAPVLVLGLALAGLFLWRQLDAPRGREPATAPRSAPADGRADEALAPEPASAPVAQRSAPTGTEHTLRGRVVDADRNGIAGVDVTLLGPEEEASPFEERMPSRTRSGPDGGFAFENLPAGRYALLAEPAGDAHDPEAPWLEASLAGVAVDTPVELVELVLARGAWIRGRTLGGSHQPLAGFVVVGLGANGEHTWSATTDADGRFELLVPAGTTWDLQVNEPPLDGKPGVLIHTERKVPAGARDLELQFVPLTRR